MSIHAQWQFHQSEDGGFRFYSLADQAWFSANENGLSLDQNEASAVTVRFIAADDCAEYPEISTNSEGVPVKGEFEDGAVWGVADAHAHLFGSMAFSGNIMAGDVFHPLGVTKALQDCRVEHGNHGWLDITGFVTSGEADELTMLGQAPLYYLTGTPFHNTEGYPDFSYWPNHITRTHAMAYYKWLERAYLGGLRLMVNLMVESGPLCIVSRELSKAYGPFDPVYQYDSDVVCNGDTSARKQLAATLQLQDYIDAQSGGPGKGWFRVVYSPEQARAVIQDKKLAVIMGVELPDLFSCIDGVEGSRPDCDADYVAHQLDEYQRLGIRTVFPVHHYDNDFGGARVFNPIIEVAKVVQDGALFDYEVCDDSDYNPLLAIKIPYFYYKLFPQALIELPLFPFLPQADHYCNAQSITPAGEHLVLELMRRGMLIETNHMSPKMKQAVVALAQYYDYPLLDTHQNKAWEGDALVEEARYLSLGGIRSPLTNMSVPVMEYNGVRNNCLNNTSQDLAIALMGYSDQRQALGLDTGVAMATDVHGMVSQTNPRFGENAQCDEMQINPVQYPFQSVDGAVTFYQQVSGNRVFDFNVEGLAHLGLLPDLIQDMRNQGMSDEYLTRLFRGAESYIQSWEKSEQRAKAMSAILP